MGDPGSYREAVRSLEYMLPENSSEIDCFVHDASLPFPDYLKRLTFDLIVLGPTFLGNRQNEKSYRKALGKYDFVRLSHATKIALPQDDYDCSSRLEEWVMNWNVDRVYSVCADQTEALYEKYSKVGEVKVGYTSYISQKWIDSWEQPKPHQSRSIDVSYRTHDLSAMRCSLRNLKFEIATRFTNKIKLIAPDLKLDMSSKLEDLIPGSGWHDFMEDSKFCLTTPSGSSVLDHTGRVRARVSEFCEANQEASFKDVKEACLKNLENIHYTAISPRNIEAALAETVQIATPGKYSGLMRPLVHYIPLDEDCSNIRSVFEMMQNTALVREIQLNCKKSILSEPRLRVQNMARELIEFTLANQESKNIPLSQNGNLNDLLARHSVSMAHSRKVLKFLSRIKRFFPILFR